MLALPDEERDLLLSLYLDGELEPEQRRAVEEKLRADPAWQAEYDALQASEQRVSRAVESNWHDGEMTDRVMARVQAAPRATAAQIQAVERRVLEEKRAAARPAQDELRGFAWTWRWPAAAAVVVAAVAVRMAFFGPQTGARGPERVARFEPAAAEVVPAQAPKAAGELFQGQGLRATADRVKVEWADGSELWLRRGVALTGLSPRRLALKEGQVLMHVAKAAQPFAIELPDGSLAEALGTRFEIDLSSGGPRVRVVEGRVRRAAGGPDGRAVEALGGQEIAADLDVRAFDPREVSARWAETAAASGPSSRSAGAPEPAAPWPQLGGSPSHSGLTPLLGPAGLATARFYPFPSAGEAAVQYASAVVGAQGRAYVLRRQDDTHSRLLVLDLSGPAGPGAWKPQGEPLTGHSQHPPVVTPKGLVVAAATGGSVQAWDPAEQRTAWKVDLGSSVFALSAGYDGTLLCSTHQRLVALDESGAERWSYAGAADFQAPALVARDGVVLAASETGKVVRLGPGGRDARLLEWPAQGRDGLFAPPVAREDGEVWLATTGGGLFRATPGGIERLETVGPVSAGPLASGVYAAGNVLCFPGGGTLALTVQGKVTALAADGAGYLYAAAKGMLYRVKLTDRAGVLDAAEPLKQGEAVAGGIAVAPGRLVVTTSEGVQVFE